MLGTIWEALSPDPCLSPYETDYQWLTQVYESVKPPSGNGKLLWHALGAKTVELINENVHVESVRDDVETLVLDAEVLEEILTDTEPGKRGQGSRDQARSPACASTSGNPKFTALGERLEKIKERHEQGFLTSLEFLKQILELAKDVVEAEKADRPGRGARPRQGSADGTLQGSEEQEHAHHRRAHRRRHRRHREESPLPRLAAHHAGRAPGAEGTAPDAAEVQAAHGSGAVRQGLRLYPAVLLSDD